MRIGVLGINYKLADLKLRELLAKACQRRFGSGNAVQEEQTFVLLSTCNRTEVYFSSHELAETHSYLLQILRQEVQEEFDHKLYSYFGQDCFSHLARVTAGLDSAILAETEIQGQVKIAYETAAEFACLPSELHFLFQKALKIGKQIREKLQMGRGMPDIEHALLHLGSHFFERVQESKVLFVGASAINHKILQFFRHKNIRNLTLCNRSRKTAEIIAKNENIALLEWKELALWQNFDWIIFGTKSGEYLIKQEQESQIGHKLVIDLCVPRNVDPNLAKVPGLTLLNIDEINHSLKIRRDQMSHLVKHAEGLINEAAQKQITLYSERETNRLRLVVG